MECPKEGLDISTTILDSKRTTTITCGEKFDPPACFPFCKKGEVNNKGGNSGGGVRKENNNSMFTPPPLSIGGVNTAVGRNITGNGILNVGSGSIIIGSTVNGRRVNNAFVNGRIVGKTIAGNSGKHKIGQKACFPFCPK